MTNNLHYRKGSSYDRKEIEELGKASYGELRTSISDENRRLLDTYLNNEETWTTLLNTSEIFLCEENDKVIGMAFLLPSGNPNEIFPADWSYIRMVGVHPAHRGRGIAKELTRMCVEFAVQSNEKTIGLHTSESMDAARHIYEALGFRKLNEIAPRYGKRYWVYKKEINADKN